MDTSSEIMNYVTKHLQLFFLNITVGLLHSSDIHCQKFVKFGWIYYINIGKILTYFP